MSSRRQFLIGAMAASVVPGHSWADLGQTAYLNAARLPDQSYALLGLTIDGGEAFRVALPARGHAAAAHPERAEAVAFARRPGTYALVIDCADGSVLARMQSPKGRHFYGHGVYSRDGTRLYTPENDYETGRGVISVWDVEDGYNRLAEFGSGGVGPHDILRHSDLNVFVVANGGIKTHPESGRTKLNISTMRPNLSYFSGNGELLEQVELPQEWHRNSIRHLAIRDDGLVAFAMQWQGDVADAPALLGLHRRGEEVRFAEADLGAHTALTGYAGSVSFSGDGAGVAISSPVGGRVQIFDANSAAPLDWIEMPDVCGLARAVGGFVATTGRGRVTLLGRNTAAAHDMAFDNHLVALS